MVALVVWGMNEVLNSQGYTQAAWWNRIPIAAWGLMGATGICCNTGTPVSNPDSGVDSVPLRGRGTPVLSGRSQAFSEVGDKFDGCYARQKQVRSGSGRYEA